MLARRQVRLAALAALQTAAALQDPVPSLDSPGDWATAPEKLPAWRLRVSKDDKESNIRSTPQFTTIVTLEVEARLSAVTAEDAQDAIEAMGDVIETAIFTNYALIALLQQFRSVSTESDISAGGRGQLAGIRLLIDCELLETFEVSPDALPPLQQININMDLQNVVDPTGTYSDPPFPDSVIPAPRTEGPDGRNEGTLQFNLPQ